MKKRLQTIIFYLLTILLFLTPVLYTTATNELYEFPKMIFVYLLGTTVVFLFIVHRLFFGGNSKRSNIVEYAFVKPDPVVVGYLAVTIISVLFSSHTYTSVWGYYSRFNGGLMSFLVFFGIYYVCLQTLDTEKFKKLINFGLLSSIPIGLYGISQGGEVTRVYSTFGQPNWFSAYLVFVIPLILQRVMNVKHMFEKLLWSLALILSFMCLWLTGSLSGFLGIFVGILYLVLVYGRKFFKKWMLLVVPVVALVGVLNFSYIKQRVSDAFVISDDPSMYNVSDPGLIRYGLWSGTLRMATSSIKVFIFGVGPETFPYEFSHFRPTILNYSSEWDFIMNKPHNYYLELLVESGIIAVVLYLLIIYKVVRSKDKFLIAAFLGLFVTHFFGWPTVYTSLLFWIGLAGIEINRRISG